MSFLDFYLVFVFFSFNLVVRQLSYECRGKKEEQFLNFISKIGEQSFLPSIKLVNPEVSFDFIKSPVSVELEFKRKTP